MLSCGLLVGFLLPLLRVDYLLAQSFGDAASKHQARPLDVLLGECLSYRPKNEWWSYQWCYKDNIEQQHFDRHPLIPQVVNDVGDFVEEVSSDDRQTFSQTYQHSEPNCQAKGSDELTRRSATVAVKCCLVDHSNKKRRLKGDTKHGTFIEKVEESSPCNYLLSVCSELVCSSEMKESVRRQLERSAPKDIVYTVEEPHTQSKVRQGTLKSTAAAPPDKERDSHYHDKAESSVASIQYSFTSANSQPVSRAEQEQLKDRVKDMFYHGYNSYMDHAYPEADLKPMSCQGGQFELIKIPLVTLIDSLDTLVVLQNFTEFKRAVGLIDKQLPSFDFDVNISVFETTIRILGGLVSAHLMAVDTKLSIYSGSEGDSYDDCLLRLATDIGRRLLPAFDTATGIPYGTVNLRSGVPRGETELASTAGAGSLVIEFEVLSCLTGDESFGIAARVATEALFDRRSALSLVGKHIHIRSGKWHETLSGVGSNSDSFYEYLLKAYLLFRRKEYYVMFREVYQAVKDHSLQQNEWFNDVDMFSGKVRTRRSESLQAFWPGLEALLGMTRSSSSLLNAFYLVLKDFEFLPEEFDYSQWDIDKKRGSSVYYPLRPELIESTYMQYMTTGDRSWLVAGRSFLQAIETHAWTECGYAAIKDITVMQRDDDMPSYFLSETCKYMYLLFDEENPFHRRHYIFSTEAHPFDTLQVGEVCASRSHVSDYEQGALLQSPRDADRDVSSLFTNMMRSFDEIDAEAAEEYVEPGAGDEGGELRREVVNRTEKEYSVWKEGGALHQDLLKCPKANWWSSPSYHLPDSSSSDIHQRKVTRARTNKSKKIAAAEKTKEKEAPSGSLFDMLKSLSSQIHAASSSKVSSSVPEEGTQESDEGEEDPFGTCPFLDDPNRAANREQSNLDESSTAVELNVGALGSFSVNVFSDGFVIHSQQFGNTMEISGIGQPSMFVKEYNASLSRAVVAMQHGEVATCEVHVEAEWKGGADGEAWQEDGYDAKYLPAELDKKRSCSFAAFGPTSNYAAFPSEAVTGSLRWLDSEESCSSPLAGNSEGLMKRAYEGQVVMAERGSCMFEEKTIQAEKAGARAVIVANSEPSLFMMAGLAQVVDGKRAEEQKELLTHIPTVMLSSTDADFVREAVQYLSAQDPSLDASVHVDITGVPVVLDSPLMGFSGHPAIRLSERVIHVHGMGAWSALLALSAEGQWQLFMMPASELSAVTPWNLQTSRGEPYCTNSNFAMDPAQAYLQTIREKCPSFVRVKDAKVVEIRK